MSGTNQLAALTVADFSTGSVSAGSTELTGDPVTRIGFLLALTLLTQHPSLNVALGLCLSDARAVLDHGAELNFVFNRHIKIR